MMRQKRNNNTRERGQAVMEVTLLMPWIIFLFIGVLDVGFYSYGAICTENAARAAAVRTAADQFSQAAPGSTSNDVACVAAWNELSNIANVYNATAPTGCSGLPASMTVVTKTLCGSNVSNVAGCTKGTITNPSCSDCDGTTWDGKAPGKADNTAASSQVTVTYTSDQLMPIPGLVGKLNLTRIAEARIIQE